MDDTLWKEMVYVTVDKLGTHVREYRWQEELMFLPEDREWDDRLHEVTKYLDPFIRMWGGEAAPTLAAPSEIVKWRRVHSTGCVITQLEVVLDKYTKTLKRYIFRNAEFRDNKTLVATHQSRLDAVGQLVEGMQRCRRNVS